MNMDPMNRKLFKSRDARNTLRGMGGIVASSPELAQTVAKYQEGGRVTGLEQMEMDPIRQGRATRIGNRTFVMLPNGVVLDARTQAAASPEETLAVQRRLNAFPERDPAISEEALAMRVNPSFATDTRDRGVGIGVSDRMPAAPAPAPTSPAMPSVGTDPDIARATPGPMSGGFLDLPPADPDPLRSMSPERLEAERMAVESGGIGEFGMDVAEGVTGAVRGAGETLQRGIGQGLSRLGAPGVGAFFLEGAESTAELSEQREQEEAAREAARAARLAEIDDIRQVTTGDPLTMDEALTPVPGLAPGSTAAPAPVPDAEVDVETAPASEEAEVVTPEKVEEAIEQAVDTPAPEMTADFDTSYAQAMERLQGVMGEGADEDTRQKAMANLAMVGLAIAAGQSPDALTNIAQGALTGMQGIQKAEAAEEAQERELRLAAMKMAADETDLAKRLASAERIAQIRNAGGATFSPQDRLYNATYTATYNQILEETGDVTQAAKAARTAAKAAAPGSSQISMDAVTSTPAPGSIVEQGGVRYQVQADGSYKPLG